MLLGTAEFASHTRVGVRTLLCCSLLLHYQQVLLEFPDSKLIERMRSCSRVSSEKLTVWATHIKDYWHRQNARFIPMDSFEPGDVSMVCSVTCIP